MRTVSGSTMRFAALFPAVLLAVIAFLVLAVPNAEASKYAGIVMDAKTGKVLYDYKASQRRYPASLTKMMTVYMMFEALEAGRLSKSARIRFSKHAASQVPSKLGVKAGRSISAEQAILALVTKSANDVAAAVAEHLGGTESQFASMMTQRARQLGMSSTTFKNASGLPNSAQVTTARDMARLGIALREHYPQYYKYFSTRSFTFNKRRMGNHNRLLGQVKGVDGIKTGYIRASGFNLVTSVQRDGRSIVAVVLGGKSGKSRNAQMTKLIGRYLHKGSKGGDRMLIAKVGGATLLPAKAPVPTFRPRDEVTIRVATAHGVSTGKAPIEAVRASAGSTFDVASIGHRLAALTAAELPVPTRAPYAGSTDPVRTAAVPRPVVESEAVHQLGYAAEPATRKQTPEGWQIQIGAVDSAEQAIELLDKARGKAPKTLGKVENYTETVDKNGTTLYRARFAGFGSKSQAWDACKVLKRKRFACLALAN